jgi:hypothetical protein
MDRHTFEHGRAALVALQSVHQDGMMTATKTLAKAIDELVMMRDDLVRSSRESHGDSGDLARTNAIISSLFGTEFPSGSFQWKRVQEARQALESLIGASRSAAN